jgi:4-hydroxy-tetrahydrodipicolinate reductase
MSPKIKVGVAGAHGRMGRELVEKLAHENQLELRATLTRQGRPSSPSQEKADMDTFCRDSDVIIDFTTPETTLSLVATALSLGKPLVIGTTGLTETQEKSLQEASKKIPLVYASNMSLGVTLMAEAVKRMAQLLPPSFDIEISERHHRHKKDAPSGTAWMLGQAAAAGRQVDLKERAIMGYGAGLRGTRKEGGIGFCISRGGGVAGDHKVDFLGEHEVITIGHRALDRGVFAEGALIAARWVVSQSPGLYSMAHVLGLAP